MQWQQRWVNLRDVLLDLVFPPRCVGCRQAGNWLCDDCLAAAERIQPPICPRCGRPVAHGRLCRVCCNGPAIIDGIRAVAYFEGTLREAIHRFKYQGTRSLAGQLVSLLVEYQAHHALPADILVPVPLHPDRFAERGYNQAALLAQALGNRIDLPVMEDALSRVKPTVPQVDLNARERRMNVYQAFQAQVDLLGQRVLLIDDVCTTGATLEACSAALKHKGVRSVWGLVLARSR